jgi:hypothetical protein
MTREPFWLVLGLLLVVIVAGFAVMGSRGELSHGRGAQIIGMAEDLPGKLFGDLRDMTVSLAESLNGTPKR